MKSKKVSLSEYLLLRIKELGITEVFGVPGDYNLAFLDKIIETKGLNWVGNCNELNAAYAADGYARIQGSAALVTTFGVGELSAVNGIAGSFAEYLPVINIVGWPATTAEKAGMLMHHTLGTGDFRVFLEMFKKVSAAVAILDNPLEATRAIDRAIEIGFIKKQPVYIGLPSNHVDVLVSPPAEKLALDYPKSDARVVQEAALRAAALIKSAKRPVILADLCALRHPMTPSIKRLLKATGIPLATMNMAKSIVEESHPNFIGGYNGDYSTEGVQARVEQSDCIISFGAMLSDFNTGGFTCNIDASSTIEIHSNHVKVKHAMYPDVYFDALLPALMKALKGYTHRETIKQPQLPHYKPKNTKLTQARFWQRMANFYQAKDIILAETGTSMFGVLEAAIPYPVSVITQPLWASIGYTVGALLGASLANRKRRALLFVGDGSFQLTAQEVSTMLRHKLTPIVFLLNNDGYTIERVIHGMKMPYNDIQPWQYAELPKVFGENVYTTQVEDEHELESVLDACKKHRDKLCFIELKLTKEDCPNTLKKLGKACDKKNSS